MVMMRPSGRELTSMFPMLAAAEGESTEVAGAGFRAGWPYSCRAKLRAMQKQIKKQKRAARCRTITEIPLSGLSKQHCTAETTNH
jgi:hypothetical protein